MKKQNKTYALAMLMGLIYSFLSGFDPQRIINFAVAASCLKHFVCNETEFYRRRSNSVVDERALHEIYMAPFKAGIDAGVAYVAGEFFHPDRSGKNTMRLNFSFMSPEKITEGVKLLAKLLKDEIL